LQPLHPHKPHAPPPPSLATSPSTKVLCYNACMPRVVPGLYVLLPSFVLIGQLASICHSLYYITLGNWLVYGNVTLTLVYIGHLVDIRSCTQYHIIVDNWLICVHVPPNHISLKWPIKTEWTSRTGR